MIVGLGGTPGSGKSYVAAEWIVRDLAAGKRVFTNMSSMNIGAISKDIVRQRYGRHVFSRQSVRAMEAAREITGRFMIIRPDEITDMILFRGRFQDNVVSHLRRSVVYLDEVMMHWFSRDYKSFTKDLVFFFTQHRKYGLDVVYIAQDLDRVDTVIRSMTQESVEVSNVRRKKFLGFLSLPLDLFLLTYKDHSGNYSRVRFVFPRRRVYGYYDSWQLFGGSMVCFADPLEEFYGDPDPVLRVVDPYKSHVFARGRVLPAPAQGAPLPEAKKSAPGADAAQ